MTSTTDPALRQKERLPSWRLLAYGSPALPLAALQLPAYAFLPTVYAESLGLSLTVVGAVLFAARLLDVLTDPIIGLLSDRSASRFGRRRPWVLAGLPLLLLGAWQLFLPPDEVNALHLMIWSIVLYVAWTMMILPLNALGAELSPRYDERTRIAGFREGFTVAGTLVALGIAGWASTQDGSEAAGQAAGLEALFWVLLALTPVTVALFLFLTPDPAVTEPQRLKLRDGVAALRKNRPFRRLIVAYVLNGVANGLPATLFLMFVSHALSRPEAAGPLLAVYFVAGVASVPFWLWLARDREKHRVWCYAMLWACGWFLLVPLLPEGAVIAFAVISVATGMALGADLTLPASMQADAVDVDTQRTGQRRTGLYFALWSMATKLALALAVGLAFPLLDLAGFVPEEDAGIWALVSLYVVAPVAFKLVAIGMMWGHPLSRAEQEAIRADLEKTATA